MGEMRNAYEVLNRTHERKRPLERARYRWEGIKMDLKEVGSIGGDWIKLVQDMNQWRAREHGTEPTIREANVFTSRATVSFMELVITYTLSVEQY
jgi:hypothetical protein